MEPFRHRLGTAANKVLNLVLLLMVGLVGIAAFLYPFFQPAGADTTAAGLTAGSTTMAHAQDAPLLFVVLIALCLGVVLSNMIGTSARAQAGGSHSKMIAALGILTAINAVLRVVPGPLGFSAMFVLPILTGYCYGATFGYLLGTLSLAVSALIGAGIGPWLPYQMFTIGWIGLTSAWLSPMYRWAWIRRHPRLEAALLAIWGMIWGLAFGFIMNVWFWPFIVNPAQADMYWQPGVGPWQTIQRYLVFYAVTSSWWDLGRAFGNLVLIALLGVPVLRLLRRFGKRFTFEVQ